MNDFKSLLNSLNLQDEESQVQVPFAPGQDVLPANYNELAQQEQAPVAKPAAPSNLSMPQLPSMKELGVDFQGVPAEPSRSPADLNTSSMSQTKTKISGTIPGSDSINGSETAEARLERLMRELNEQRNKEREDAQSRQFKANIFKALAESAGGIIGGSQAMNTGARVTPAKTEGFDVGDLVGQVDKKFAGDREALLDQYKQLLNARDRADQRKFQQESLNVQREGNRIKEKLAEQKANKLSNTLTPGEEAADKTFAKDYNNLTSKGFNNAETAISRIEKVAEELEKEGDGLLSAGGGRSSSLPDFMRSRDSVRWRDAAQNEANATLKELFPGSLSDDERRAAAREFYNDQLSNADNAKILRAKAQQLRQNVADQRRKADYFSQYGTLKGLGVEGPATTQKNTIRIQGPSGQIAEVSADKAEKYLSKPGYKKVD